MASILPFDELNSLADKLRKRFGSLPLPTEDNKEIKEDVLDMLLDFFLLSYAAGNIVTNDNLGADWQPTFNDADKTVNKVVAGKTWTERVEDYFSSGGTVDDLIRIAETEMHRDANEAALETAIRAGAKTKTWHCTMLPTSRDSHIYLDGVTAPIDGEFYSINGGSTQFPGEWGIAEEDVNCLCWLTFDK